MKVLCRTRSCSHYVTQLCLSRKQRGRLLEIVRIKQFSAYQWRSFCSTLVESPVVAVSWSHCRKSQRSRPLCEGRRRGQLRQRVTRCVSSRWWCRVVLHSAERKPGASLVLVMRRCCSEAQQWKHTSNRFPIVFYYLVLWERRDDVLTLVIPIELGSEAALEFESRRNVVHRQLQSIVHWIRHWSDAGSALQFGYKEVQWSVSSHDGAMARYTVEYISWIDMIAKKGACFTGRSRTWTVAGHPAEHETLTGPPPYWNF